MTRRHRREDPAGRIPCRQVVELVTDHLEGVLDRATTTEVTTHLAHCRGCAEYLDQMRETVRRLGQLPLEGLPGSGRGRLLAAFAARGRSTRP